MIDVGLQRPKWAGDDWLSYLPELCIMNDCWKPELPQRAFCQDCLDKLRNEYVGNGPILTPRGDTV